MCISDAKSCIVWDYKVFFYSKFKRSLFLPIHCVYYSMGINRLVYTIGTVLIGQLVQHCMSVYREAEKPMTAQCMSWVPPQSKSGTEILEIP